ncbi:MULTISPECIES: flagellar biosynthetic protein FliO [Halomonas]|uniref:Flagellar protein n=1 Tax=Halomonas halophila TaxID=29573 RepID=A0ABQ0U7Q2_9GAMM|nr:MULTISPECIES: flagellar biosynthetic protein FliO [Halomonas]MDR5889238.1 flagellar biosynthetic protein FliO [Halomonas salina]RAH37120.1 flagellar biosynthetic protein FliO [Halomonas sp. SL1]WJY07208.1 flagellar biosynthetic protein FliO [Halomonas halophila]GEK74410.1 flagellar protein [Halomonas halophila]
MSESASGAVADGLGGGEALIGMATLGKTAAALALVLAIIVACSLLLRRLNGGGRGQGQRPRLVGSTSIGQRERVVIVEVEGTWLVLGVGGGQVNKLHELPAPESPATAPAFSEDDGFAARFAKALRHNAGLGRHDRDRP